MYEVTTIIKTLATNVDRETAMKIAEEASKIYSYVEIKRIISTAPWYAVSEKIFR